MKPQSRILTAIEALKRGHRRDAAALLEQELREGEPVGQRWASVAKLAMKIGEIDMAVDASRRFAFTPPVALTAIVGHCGTLAQVGRSDEAIALLDTLPQDAQRHPAVLHFRATIASESGDFERAEALLRRSIEADGAQPQAWFALAMLKTFDAQDSDFDAMVQLEDRVARGEPATHARFTYGLAKALVDQGRVEEGFAAYARGAAIRRSLEPYDRERQERFVEALMEDFDEAAFKKLTPSRFEGQRAIFVNGLPRSGTTLVESILVAHSRVSEGAEVNLMRPALIPAGDTSFTQALAYQEHSSSEDPWGDVARDYHHMLAVRFPGDGLIVDKTLSQSMIMGLLLHAMPEAKVVWMRRRAEDSALSSYRSYFTSPVSWSWAWEDIAHQFRLEDRLFAHWVRLFPDRILPIAYETLVREPEEQTAKIIGHVGLEPEDGLLDFHRNARKVRTASVQQVRSAITTDAVGKADRFADHLAAFRRAYSGE